MDTLKFFHFVPKFNVIGRFRNSAIAIGIKNTSLQPNALFYCKSRVRLMQFTFRYLKKT